MLKKRISEYGFIAVGALILALGLQLFMVPSKLTTGGVSGLATVFYYYFKIPLSVTVFSVNLLLMLFAVRSFSLSALLKNFVGIGFLSLFLSVIEPISFGITDPFLSAVFGGVMSGIGIGLTLLHNGSTGGSDFAAMLLHRFFFLTSAFPPLSSESILR